MSQLRIKVKVIPASTPPPSIASNVEYWRRHLPDDAICFGFAIEGGIIAAHNATYLDGRWITVGRAGGLYIHGLEAGFRTLWGQRPRRVRDRAGEERVDAGGCGVRHVRADECEVLGVHCSYVRRRRLARDQRGGVVNLNQRERVGHERSPKAGA